MRLIPREKKFFRMFSDVSQNLTEGARLLHDIMQNPANLGARIARLQEIEHRGDEMTHDIIRMLNQTFITPFDREDIHRLSSSLDDVLDFVNAAAVRMTLYGITVPPPPAAELAALIVKQSEELAEGVSLLQGNKKVLDHCVEVNRLEGGQIMKRFSTCVLLGVLCLAPPARSDDDKKTVPVANRTSPGVSR